MEKSTNKEIYLDITIKNIYTSEKESTQHSMM